MDFIITIDTEGDNQWEHGRDLTVENIKHIPRFQALCERYQVKPTYLVTTEVCFDSFAIDLFTGYIENDSAEIGAHLHAWTTPPFHDKAGFRENDLTHTYATELSNDLLMKKIQNLTNQITASFGKRPTSFRSGRYGFNEEVAKALITNSYVVDSSVTPFVKWSRQIGLPDGNGGPNFLYHNPFPSDFRFEEGTLREIPITILPTRFPLNANWDLARRYFSIVNDSMFYRILRKLHRNNQPIWARPIPEMTFNVFEKLLLETLKKGMPFLTMMFHSSELMPGCSKYRPDKNSVEELYRLLEDIFKLLKSRKIRSLTLTEAAQICSVR